MRRTTRPFFALIILSHLVTGCTSRQKTGNEVTFTTADNWTIHADFISPPNAGKAVILLHQRNGSGADWKPLVDKITPLGIASLALDLRGAGRSLGPRNGDNAPWDVTADIDAARKFLDDHGFKGKPVVLAGASYGANNALIYAATHPGIAGVALLSPGEDYHGLKIADAAKQYHGPLLLLTAEGDSITGRGPQIIRESTTVSAGMAVDGDSHGTQMLVDHVQALQFLVNFLRSDLKTP